MSDMMITGVIRMPYEMAMDNEISRRQFYQRAQQALNERDKYKQQRDELLDALKFYEEERNYRAGTYHSESMDRLHETPPKVILDRGVKARAAIKKAEE